jgi:hypothetical protein
MGPELGTARLDRAILQESTQVVGQVARRRVAVPNIPGDRLEHDGLEVARHRWISQARSLRLVERELMQQFGTIAAVVGRLEGHELVKCRTERIDIRTVIDNLAARRGLLGAHVPQRSQQVARHRELAVDLHPCQAEVGDPEIAARVEQQIGRLDVAVDDPHAVGVVEGFGGLHSQAGDRAKEGACAGRGTR